MAQRPLYLSFCLLGSLVMSACNMGSWEADEPSPTYGALMEQSPSFATQGESTLASDREEGDEARVLTEAPAPRAQTPPEEESPSNDEKRTPLPPLERERAEEKETSSSSDMATEEQAEPQVTLSLQSFVAAGTSMTLSASTQGPVAYVSYEVDAGVSIGIGQGSNHTLVYTFWTPGGRPVTARGYDSSGSSIAVDSGLVVVFSDAADPSEEPGDQGPSSVEPSSCSTGQITDCAGTCVSPSWVGDEICDDGTNTYVDFMCDAFEMDGGDCDADAVPSCPVAQQEDCNGLCVKSAWIGDDFCDDGTQYDADFNCAAFQFDQGDCAAKDGGDLSQLPYFYQYDNLMYPGSSCQNTSLAMVLKHYGWTGAPDDITASVGKNKAQSPSSLAEVFNDYAESSGIPERLVAHTNGSIAGLQALLNEGKPVIVHGYFTSFGHVLVVTGYSGSSYTVNDPAGKWSQTWKGGYPYAGGSQSGKQVSYASQAFELAISSTNGSNYVPLWYHEIVD